MFLGGCLLYVVLDLDLSLLDLVYLWDWFVMWISLLFMIWLLLLCFADCWSLLYKDLVWFVVVLFAFVHFIVVVGCFELFDFGVGF